MDFRWLAAALAALTALALGHGALAQEAAVPVTPACAQALQALDAARQRRDAAPVTEPLRQRAIKECLGSDQPPPRPTGRVAQPPMAVEPTPVAPQAPAVALPLPPAPTGPLRIDRPGLVTNCDTAGCWDADGRRLNRVGPDLMGPRGACMAQGAGFVCP